jgi:hypothetical protein
MVAAKGPNSLTFVPLFQGPRMFRGTCRETVPFRAERCLKPLVLQAQKA